ncbi:hypothetical protein VP1G_05667 [Cytospora mali]|uniref:Uncharacterized protein n=1 Tax=Cytospora mali TaxID=578113 RepID=A0A194V375_CYTMA|nr:hypothetical protein VP1G_05667 [Valsa mali var. pyri (nom. inval.)]
MSRSCAMQRCGGDYRGPPLPLIIVPVVYQIVRASPDLKIARYVKRLIKKGGPMSVAENAHHIIQYALSRVPSNVLYWFASKVLNLSPEIAMQTTKFLKSRTELESLPQQASSAGVTDGGAGSALVVPSDIERRLEKLEMDYQMLQEQHKESLKLLTYKTESMEVPREIALPTPPQSPEAEVQVSTELVQVEASPSGTYSRAVTSDMETQTMLQEIGLRLGKVVLEWAGDMMKQTILSAANAKSSSHSKVAAAGLDLTGRLGSAIIT